MRSFVQVVESGGFSAAAARLQRAPSSMSRQVEQLELHLGSKLLARSTRSLRLTEAGEHYYLHARRILGEIDDLTERLSARRTRPTGVLRVNAVSPFGRGHVAPLLPAFHRQYPEVHVHLTLSDRIVDVVREQTDVAIRVGALEDSRLVARRLIPSRLLVCGSPDYFARWGKPASPPQLSEHACLSYGQDEPRASWQIGGKRVPVAGPFSCNDVESLLIAARAGMGLINLPDWVVAEDVAQGRLQIAFANDESAAAGVYALYPDRDFLPAKVRVFLDFLTRRIARRVKPET